MNEYTEVFLEQEAEWLSGTGRKTRDITVLCECGGTVTQEDNVCPDCGHPFVWYDSTIWKRKFGQPRRYIKLLKGIDLKPLTPFEVEVCVQYGRGGEFANETQMLTARRLERRFPVAYLTKLLAWANKKHISFYSYESAVVNPGNLKSHLADEPVQDEIVMNTVQLELEERAAAKREELRQRALGN